MPTSIEYKNEEPYVKNIFDTISTTIIFISQAYSHFNAYSFGELTDEESRQLKNEIFTFQNMASQFVLVVQFCKLMENKVQGDKGESSLYKLNNLLQKKYPDDFKEHSKNVKILKEIQKSKIFGLVSDLRNKSYGHADNHPLNKPLTFIFFKKPETSEFKEMLLKAIEVFKNCYRLYDIGTGFHHFYDSGSPKNFLKSYLRNKAFWYDKHRRNQSD